MSKTLVVTSTCDNHRLTGTEGVTAHGEHTLGVDNQVALVDLCEECEGRIIPMIVALLRMGVPAGSNPLRPRVRKGGPDVSMMTTMCPECGKVSKNRSALSTHLASQHQKRFRDYPNLLRTEADYVGLPYHF